MSDAKRRELVFASLDEVTNDIEQLAAGEPRTSGGHTFAEIVRHLAIANEMVAGKISPPKLPWYMRLVMPFMGKKIMSGPVNPGFKLPSNMEAFFWSDEPVGVPEAVARFNESVELYKEKGPIPVHPIFGPAPSETTNAMLLKHAAMHLSFVHPA